MNPIDKPTEHDEYNELLSVVGNIVDAGHMDQEHLARLRAHLGCRPDPAGVVREVASRGGEAPNRLPPLPPINILEASAFRGYHLVISAEAARRREEVLLAYITRTARAHAAQGAVEREPFYMVGEFWSSSNPKNKVRCLADGEKEIAESEQHHSFIRWLGEPSAIQTAARAVILARDNFGWSADTDAKIEDLRRVLAGEPSGDALDASPEKRAEQFIQSSIDASPQPLRRLGEYLARVLDEDQWVAAERLLLGISVPDAGRLEWLMHRLSGAELRSLGIHTSAGCAREDLDAAITAARQEPKL